MIWGLQSPDPSLQSAVAAKTLGTIVLVIALLMTANYLYTVSLIRRAQRGEDVIGRWIVAPDSFAKFRDIERARKTRRNNWRVLQNDMPQGLEVIFTRRSVVVGNTWFRLAAKGMTHFSFARIETGEAPSSVDFSMRLTIAAPARLVRLRAIKVICACRSPMARRWKQHASSPISAD